VEEFRAHRPNLAIRKKMFKSDFATMTGTIPLELPGERYVEAALKIDDKGEVSIVFNDVDMARALFQSGLEGSLMSLSFGWMAARSRGDT